MSCCQKISFASVEDKPFLEEMWEERVLRMTGVDPTLCKACGEGRLRLAEAIPRPAPAAATRQTSGTTMSL